MKEDFLHYLWKYKKFDFLHAKTTAGQEIQLIFSGMHNVQRAGPDFLNAQLKIGKQHWAGNVEIHVKSSDWYAHGHHKDTSYDNVILHVVWEHDVEVFRKNNAEIPTLLIADYTSEKIQGNYEQLLQRTTDKFIHCQADFSGFSDFVVENWLEKLYTERLSEKAQRIYQLLEENTNHWEQTLWVLLAKNFGLNVNGQAFYELALSLPFHLLKKENDAEALEALFFGQANMLEPAKDAYQHKLLDRYRFYQHKYKLRPITEKVNFFRLRPHNFPSIRLAQLARLYAAVPSLFGRLMTAKNISELYDLLQTDTSPYWKNHYSFGKESKQRSKKLSRSFIDLLMINTILPLRFTYEKEKGSWVPEQVFEMMQQLAPERNTIVGRFSTLRQHVAKNALHSQALLQLYHRYCTQHRCLHCRLGMQVLQAQ